MNRDALIATLIGVVVGIIIASFVLMGPRLKNIIPSISLPTISLPKKETKTPDGSTDSTSDNGSLIIDSPEHESIQTQQDVLISGKTKPNAFVVIIGPNNEDVLRAGDDGAYAATIELSEGLNNIHVSSYVEDDDFHKNITVFYTKEEL